MWEDELREAHVPEVEHYRVADASKIIAALLNGDESLLGTLDTNFQEALSVRMTQRIQELNDGAITEGYFREEVEKKIMVAGNGLWAADFPAAYASTVS